MSDMFVLPVGGRRYFKKKTTDRGQKRWSDVQKQLIAVDS